MKRWINFVLDNAKLFVILGVLLFIASVFLIRGLNIEAFPDPSPPVIEIVALYPGKSAHDVEKRITIPLEIALSGMPGLKVINSISTYGLSDIKCKFSYEVTYQQARQEVINRISMLSLPDQVTPQIIPNPTGEVMRYMLVGNRNLMDLRTIQDWIVIRYIKTAEGVEDVGSYGGYIKAYTVEVIPDKLARYGLSVSDVVNALSNASATANLFPIDSGSQYYMGRGMGLISSEEDIKDSIVLYKDGHPIRVGDIADVKVGNLPRTGIVGVNNKDDVVMGIVILRRDFPSLPAIRSIRQKIEELNSYILPKDVKVVPFYERGNLIFRVIEKTTEAATVGVFLVFLFVFLFLGSLTGAIAVSVVMILAMLISLAVMSVRGESASFLSISAIDFGILTDIPLILVESYYRNARQLGLSRRAFLGSSEEVGKNLILSILFISVSFLPVLLMEGAEKRIFSPMVKTYIYAISSVVALTFSFLIAVIYLFERKTPKENPIIRLLERRYVAFLYGYRPLGPKSFLLIILLILGLSVFFISRNGMEFIPKMDEGNLYIRVIFNYDSSLSSTYENAKKIRDFLLKIPEIKTVEFQVGRPEDGTDTVGPYNSEYFVDLKPYKEWKNFRNKEELEEYVREGLRQMFPYADIDVSQYMYDNLQEVLTGVKGENAVKIFGDDVYALDKIAKQIKERLEKVEGITDVGIVKEVGQPELVIEPDRKKLLLYGLTVQNLMDTISAALGVKEAGQVIEGDKSFPIVVKFPDSVRSSISELQNIPLVLPDGSVIPLSSVAKVYIREGLYYIYRENYKRYVAVKFSVSSRDLSGTIKKAQQAVKDIKLPEGYYLQWSGQYNSLQEAIHRLLITGSLTFLILLILLYAVNRSVRNALIVLSAVVFSFFGGALSLYITGMPFSLSAFVGFVSILGINMLNASIMLEVYKKAILRGLSREEAIRTTLHDRFGATFMSSVVAAFGLLPSALAQGVGTQVQKPLAVVVVGGMLTSGMLMLLLFPHALRYSHADEE
ncbi:efflux RND transporter permease subunit [Thermocrinis minervae]|uniref:Cobalt-zinc-cadmium resistance protein CzcA n=1 Tax=Thermocrinis minervae TaxID=381751 RepID=A0A1M6RN31_9AQUI|nr:CusA/CzcA family heavy metal efflux RND transporter [Thermocrinis minervae]SHK33854.1 cobalt-zinc-cadmium resistance protein CzcA [Thermocrinis minervae]